MKNLIKYFYNTNRQFMFENSYRNCHCKGLHSIVLTALPDGNLLRVYWAKAKEHQLHLNDPEKLYMKMSLGIHAHSKNLYFDVLHGTLNNVIAEVDDEQGINFSRYTFSSKINGGDGGFTDERKAKIVFKSNTEHRAGQNFFMNNSEMHTVHAHEDRTCIWAVYESNPSKEIGEKYTYSNHDLTLVDNSELYQKFENMKEFEEFMSKFFSILG